MRLFTLIWAALFALNSLLSAQSSVLLAEQNRFAAMVARDTIQLRHLLHNDLIYLHSNGFQESKSEHIANVGSGTIVYKSITRKTEPQVRKFGKTALITGKVLVVGQYKGKDFTLVLLYTAVYLREKKFWRLLNWQSTRLETD